MEEGQGRTYRPDLHLLQVPNPTCSINIFLYNGTDFLCALAGVHNHTTLNLDITVFCTVGFEDGACFGLEFLSSSQYVPTAAMAI